MNKRRIKLILMCISMIVLMAGCGKKFDAGAYLSALLDNSYKNDSKAFVSQKIGTKEEAQTIYQQGLEAELEGLFKGSDVSTEIKDAYSEVFGKIFAGVKYKVKGSQEQEDGSYIVTVEYERMNIYAPSVMDYREKAEVLKEEWQQAADSGSEVPDAEEQRDKLLMLLNECFAQNYEKVTYAETAETQIHIIIKDNQYQPSQEDVVKLERLLFDVDEMEALNTEQLSE